MNICQVSCRRMSAHVTPHVFSHNSSHVHPTPRTMHPLYWKVNHDRKRAVSVSARDTCLLHFTCAPYTPHPHPTPRTLHPLYWKVKPDRKKAVSVSARDTCLLHLTCAPYTPHPHHTPLLHKDIFEGVWEREKKKAREREGERARERTREKER